MPSSACKTCARSEEHTSELQSHDNLVCRLLLEKQSTHVADGRPEVVGNPLQRDHARAGARGERAGVPGEALEAGGLSARLVEEVCFFLEIGRPRGFPLFPPGARSL